MKPQSAKILRHLEQHGSITPLEAERICRTKRLAARVCELRRLGYHIIARIETGVNADGDRVRYARYWMRETDENIERGENNA